MSGLLDQPTGRTSVRRLVATFREDEERACRMRPPPSAHRRGDTTARTPQPASRLAKEPLLMGCLSGGNPT